MTPLLEIEALTVDLPGGGGWVRVLDGVSLQLEAGGALGIVGESGSGKSMTALAVMGLLPDGARCTGAVRLAGRSLLGRPDREIAALRGRSMAMIFQEPMTSLNPVMPIGRQIAEGPRLHLGLSRREAEARARALLDRVGLTAAGVGPERFPHELSGGQRQRVMIAIALATGPGLLVADEPTTALDVTTQGEILALLATLSREDGMALLLISHDLGVIAETTDRMAVMYHGRVVEQGSTASIFRRVGHPYTRGLLAAMPPRGRDVPRLARLATIPGQVPAAGLPRPPCVFEPRCPLALPVCGQPPPLVEIDPGHATACHRAGEAPVAFRSEVLATSPIAANDGRPLLQLIGLSRSYGGARSRLFGQAVRTSALDDVSLSVGRGESVGLIGESGSGKSTLARLAMGLDRPTAGRVLFDGKDLAALGAGDLRRLRRRFQIVLQDPYGSLDPRHRVGRIVDEPLRALMPELGEDERRRRVADALESVGLESGLVHRYPHQFSGGQRQRIAIARALVTGPELVIADEAVSALDVSIQAQILNLLDDLRRARGLAYLFISHDLSVVRHLTERVLVLHRGRVVEAGPTDDILRRPEHPYTRALVAAVPLPDPRRRRTGLEAGPAVSPA